VARAFLNTDGETIEKELVSLELRRGVTLVYSPRHVERLYLLTDLDDFNNWRFEWQESPEHVCGQFELMRSRMNIDLFRQSES
jgi:hypothetical protein